jgi:hypothetical protein
MLASSSADLMAATSIMDFGMLAKRATFNLAAISIARLIITILNYTHKIDAPFPLQPRTKK